MTDIEPAPQKENLAPIQLAGCLIIDDRGGILLIHRKTEKRDRWETVGGGVGENELPEDAAKREAEEEAGITVEVVKRAGAREFEEFGIKYNYTWWLAKIVKGEPSLGEERFDKIRYWSWEELGQTEESLSPNLANLVEAYSSGQLQLE